MYPYLRSQSSASSREYNTGVNNSPSYLYDQTENRKYHISSEQRMVGFEKFIRRYESMFFFPIIIMS